MKRSLLVGLLFLFAATTAWAADPVYTSRGVAIKGYDAVAYHLDEKPTKGSGDFAYSWNGATWHFASAKNRELFAGDPDKYAPAYGGWCAYAMARGSTAKIDPNAFTLHDGRLFLNYSPGIQKKWLAKRDRFIADADKNYPEVVDR